MGFQVWGLGITQHASSLENRTVLVLVDGFGSASLRVIFNEKVRGRAEIKRLGCRGPLVPASIGQLKKQKQGNAPSRDTRGHDGRSTEVEGGEEEDLMAALV